DLTDRANCAVDLWVRHSSRSAIPFGMTINATALNVAALIASLLALSVSAVFATRQSAIMKASNHLPVILDYFRELRDHDFIEREFRLREEIGSPDPSLGFTGLPASIRADAAQVCFFYLSVTYIVEFSGIDEKIFEYMVARMRFTWNAVRKHVEGERALRNNP